MTLKIAAKYANYTNFAGDPETFARKSELLQQHCAAVGTAFDAITRSSNFNVIVGADEAEVNDRLERLRDRLQKALPSDTADSTVDGLRGTPGVGTPEQIVENITAVRKLGLEYGIAYFGEAAYDTSGIELFEREVLPALD